MKDQELDRYLAEAFCQMDGQGEHPSFEEIAKFARGEPSGTYSQSLRRHMVDCDICLQRLREFEQFLEDADNPPAQDLTAEWEKLQKRIHPTRSVLTQRWVGMAAGLAVVIGMGYSGIRIFLPSTETLLARARQEQRNSEYRIAGAGWSPVHQLKGGSDLSVPPLLKAEARLIEDLRSHPNDPDTLRLQGEAQLIGADPADAVRSIQRASDLRPRDARILSDLGVAYARRGDLQNQLGDYMHALDCLSRSLQLQPRSPESVFNRALVLEKLQQKAQAIAEWEHYLTLDSSSAWATEARTHMANLKAEVKAWQDARGQITSLPDKFLAQVAASRPVDADAYLDIAIREWLPAISTNPAALGAAHALARILTEQHGDLWLTNLLASTQSPDLRQGLQSLAAAHHGNLNGTAPYVKAALQQAQDATAMFDRAGIPVAGLEARLEEVNSRRRSFDSPGCVDTAERLDPLLEPRYPWLRAQTAILYGICLQRMGRLDEAAVALRRALQISRSSSFGATYLYASNMYLSILGHIGLQSEVYASAERSLRTFWTGAHSPLLFHQVVDELREIARRSDQRYTAWSLAQSDVWAIDLDHDQQRMAIAHANLAAAAQAVDAVAEARANLAVSSRLFPSLPAGSRLETEITLAKVALANGETDLALEGLLRVQSDLNSTPSFDNLYYYSTLGEAYRRKGKLAEAMGAFHSAIKIGTERVESFTERERAGVLATTKESFRGLTATTLAISNDDREALQTWQSYRTLDSKGHRNYIPSPDRTVLWFAELPDEFVGWLNRGDQIVSHRFSVSKDIVISTVARFLRESSDPSSDGRALRQDARSLDDWMVEPFSAQLPLAGSELVLELDGALTGMPAQSLISRDGKYLGDRFSVVISEGPGNAPANRLGPNARVLLVVNPAITGNSAARFPPLSDASKEAAAARTAFPAATLLEGRNATLSQVLPALQTADVVHFTGHGYTDAENGALLLAADDPEKADYQLLRSQDLQSEDWSQSQLAVLSACTTAAGEILEAHNPEGLVRALTRAGVPRVVASLWNVDSAATAELMTQFYAALAGSQSPAHALQSAQKSVRRHAGWEHPFYWAGFQLYGTT